ncbi:MAG TPA: AmmeMemoRadiSam system protein B [Anaerolineales bacterium]|nr:AmmeMemoRadiSam system protein B [Anaerolineales bacterium]
MAFAVRPSPLAGRWYEADPEVLARTVDGYLDSAQLPALEGEVIAVIAPHAGHTYSGPVAGYAFAAIRRRSPDLVAVIGPMHHPYVEPLITTAYDAYATPLGAIPVDKDALRELDVILRLELGFGLSPVTRDPEHSLEIELPFLQRAFPPDLEWKLLPVMDRAREPRVSQGLGKALAQVLRGKNFVLVASTDLSHFYNQQTALAYDRVMLNAIESFNPAEAFDLERAGKGFACGLGAFTAVLWAARELGADKVKVLRHATSGNVTGDYSSVVGYGAAVILRTSS